MGMELCAVSSDLPAATRPRGHSWGDGPAAHDRAGGVHRGDRAVLGAARV